MEEEKLSWRGMEKDWGYVFNLLISFIKHIYSYLVYKYIRQCRRQQTESSV
jgi:hypothetical protein